MTDELFSVRDHVTLVSGGSRGIGRALAAGFAGRGARVVIASRDGSVLEAAAADMSTPDNPVTPMVCDVSDPAQIEATVAGVVDDFGRIDTLINVAGVNRRKRAETVTLDDYDFILDINLKGAFLMCQAAGRHMLERGSGVQINIESLNTYAPLKGVAPYAISKGGMMLMTRSLATEWGPRGVRVNSLSPGFPRVLDFLAPSSGFEFFRSPRLSFWRFFFALPAGVP